MRLNTTQAMDIQPQTSSDGLDPTRRSVHFDLPSDEDDAAKVERARPRPRKKRPKEPAYTPRAVFGLFLPDELVPEIGWRCTPHWKDKDRNNLTSADRSFITNEGILFASTYCRQKFPDIPLRWHHTVLAYGGDPFGLHPILVLGHMNSRKMMTIDVTTEEMERMRAELGLGDQQPKWYRIALMA